MNCELQTAVSLYTGRQCPVVKHVQWNSLYILSVVRSQPRGKKLFTNWYGSFYLWWSASTIMCMIHTWLWLLIMRKLHLPCLPTALGAYVSSCLQNWVLMLAAPTLSAYCVTKTHANAISRLPIVKEYNKNWVVCDSAFNTHLVPIYFNIYSF